MKKVAPLIILILASSLLVNSLPIKDDQVTDLSEEWNATEEKHHFKRDAEDSIVEDEDYNTMAWILGLLGVLVISVIIVICCCMFCCATTCAPSSCIAGLLGCLCCCGCCD